MILTIVGGSISQENVSQHQLFQNIAYDIFYIKRSSRIIAVIITVFQLRHLWRPFVHIIAIRLLSSNA